MKTIRTHSHEDREKILQAIIPFIKRKFGSNLIALAACCSFARDDDSDYSDLELTAFVKTMPDDKPRDGVAKIFDGLLIELIWMTKETYLKTTLDVNGYWHYSGSDTLKPILNAAFIRELASYTPPNLRGKCHDQAVGVFAEVQETVGKVLNAISQSNHQGMPLLFLEMLNQFLRALSFLNLTPYTTASRMIAQAREFEIRPESLGKLLDLAVEGDYRDFVRLGKVTVEVFEELEILYEQLGLPLMDVDLDPDRPIHSIRRMQ